MFDILSNFTEFGTSLALRNGSEYGSYEEAPKDFQDFPKKKDVSNDKAKSKKEKEEWDIDAKKTA